MTAHADIMKQIRQALRDSETLEDEAHLIRQLEEILRDAKRVRSVTGNPPEPPSQGHSGNLPRIIR